MDIEGSEVEFFKSESLFLERCDNIIVEWHKWKVSINDVRNVLETQGFRLKTTLLESDMTGTAVFERG